MLNYKPLTLMSSGKQSLLQNWHFSFGNLLTQSTKKLAVFKRDGLGLKGGSEGLGFFNGGSTHILAISTAWNFKCL